VEELREKLKYLMDMIAEKKHTQATLDARIKQLAELQPNIKKAEEVLAKEQKEAQKLEGQSLRTVFFGLMGQLEVRLEKEQAEAWEAYLKHNILKQEAESIQKEIDGKKEKLQRISDAEKEIEGVKSQIIESIKATDGINAAEIISREQEISVLEVRIKNISEAIEMAKALSKKERKIADEYNAAVIRAGKREEGASVNTRYLRRSRHKDSSDSTDIAALIVAALVSAIFSLLIEWCYETKTRKDMYRVDSSNIGVRDSLLALCAELEDLRDDQEISSITDKFNEYIGEVLGKGWRRPSARSDVNGLGSKATSIDRRLWWLISRLNQKKTCAEIDIRRLKREIDEMAL